MPPASNCNRRVAAPYLEMVSGLSSTGADICNHGTIAEHPTHIDNRRYAASKSITGEPLPSRFHSHTQQDISHSVWRGYGITIASRVT